MFCLKGQHACQVTNMALTEVYSNSFTKVPFNKGLATSVCSAHFCRKRERLGQVLV